jgi:hypothetical protein
MPLAGVVVGVGRLLIWINPAVFVPTDVAVKLPLEPLMLKFW